MSGFDQRIPQGWKVWSEDGQPESAGGQQQDPRWMRELDRLSGTGPERTCTIPLKNLVPLLIQAFQSNRSWLDDFAEDSVVIDADLHEVLMAYQKYQQDHDRGSDAGESRPIAA